MTADGQTAATPDTGIPDAALLRRRLLRQRLRSPAAWRFPAVFGLAVGVFGFLIASGSDRVAIGLVFLGIGLLCGAFGMVVTVGSKARDDALSAYAAGYGRSRGMSLSPAELPPSTPLLRKGDLRDVKAALEGELSSGASGTLAFYEYTEQSSDGQGGTSETHFANTLTVCDVPDAAAKLPGLYVKPKVGPRALERLEDAFRNKERVHLESEKLDARFEIFTDSGQDQNWLHRLFSPSLIAWLTDETGFSSLEYENGVLCCSVRGYLTAETALDRLRADSGEVATRLAAEAREGGATS